MPDLERAIAIATQAHAGQKDKAGQPYILHPLRMMFRVEGDSAKMAAVLHDVVEDTAITLDALRLERFSAEVIDAVELLTRRESDTYEQFIERVLPNPIARAVKLADLEDNMDVRRIDEFTAKDAARMQKYLAAWKRIKSKTA